VSAVQFQLNVSATEPRAVGEENFWLFFKSAGQKYLKE